MEPPFSLSKTTGNISITHPAAVARKDGKFGMILPKNDLVGFLEIDLIPTRLDKVYRHLHYAGAPRFAWPIHRQILMGREIVITEEISEHLVWHRSRIFLKPLSPYLLSYEFWNKYMCSDVELHRSACGFLLSYIWLVRYRSDFNIAKAAHLLPDDLQWEAWTSFATSFAEHINMDSLHQVARRYQYAELRLSRLNRIYRYTPTAFSFRHLVRGFLFPSTWYQDFFSQHFGWLLAAFAFFSVVLGGLQVGLATDQLGHNASFQRMSYNFVVFSLIFIAICLAGIVLTGELLASYFYIAAKLHHHHIQSERQTAKEACVDGELTGIS